MTLLLADPLIRAVPVHDDGEPLIPVPFRLLEPHRPPQLARRSVVERLEHAQALLPRRFRLSVVEAHRSPESQLGIWNRYDRSLRALHPQMPDAERERHTSRFVSPIDVAPHVAGAAVDVTLSTASGDPVWMGTRVDATPEESDGACFSDARNIDRRSRRNRAALAAAMSGAGFINYPTEWWHWSFGDRYWAAVTDAPAALFGPLSFATTPAAAADRAEVTR